SVRLQDAGVHSFGHFGGSVSDVDLTACDVVLTAVQREALGKTGNGMLGGGGGDMIRARGHRGDGSVVDDASAARALVFHQLECGLRAKERSGEVDVDDGGPGFEG